MSSRNAILAGARRVPGARLRLLPLLVAAALSSQAQAADLWSIARDALDNNADLASSRATYQSVEEARNVERGDLLPQIDATATAANHRTFESQSSAAGGGGGAAGGISDDDYNSASIGVEATQALFDATNWYQLKRSENQIDQQALTLEQTRQQTLYDVANAYFQILQARDILAARVAQEKAIGRQLEQAKEQFQVGLIAITDVHEAQASFDLARAQRIAAESDLQVSFEALERLTGKRYDSIEGLSDDLPIESPEPGNRNAWVSLAMENNPTLLATREGIDIAQDSVDIARSGHLPTLGAYADYNYSDNDVDYLEGHNSGAEIGLRANLPIFHGGSTSAQVRSNSYQLEAAQYDFESQRRQTTQQVRSLYTQVVNDVQSVEAQRQAIVSNRSALEATRSGYEVGTRNIVDVLQAEQNLYDAQASYAESRYTYVTDLLALRRESGILDIGALRTLNDWLKADQTVRLNLPEGAGSDDAMMDIGEPPVPPSEQ
ncbi:MULTISPECIES: TolC family outer membrane protein [unclassified Modicisalibacter]|uniref:TolC family outer membrane protein n=1 Tax=unclassified Modicisalibacter TaxID=2679913 RepID=UPI001CCDEFA4|nr:MULTISPECIES: TolC family outer membrane protein [unclassified Modicisalibacter]MBZ9557653.1 TolC family outer membrane protein [Modicisalibacter sp. R2A 31.J]MBZ9573683.1 TolC family outer membrane protein [Modicisalibacter sp. MOD 31.J]